MDANGKILQFESYEALMAGILNDLDDSFPLRCRYPVRFIMLNNFNVFTRLATDLSIRGVQSLNIEDLIESNHERWITTDELARVIKSQTQTTLVTPFSELVRFYEENEFRGFFNEIILIEDIDRPKKRIYIPLIGLQNRFSNFLNRFARIEESAPIWAYLEDEHKTEVFLSKIKYNEDVFSQNSEICCISTVYDWLRFWKNQAPQTKIVVTSGPIYRRYKYSDPDNIFTFSYINNSYEYINSFLEINIPFSYIPEENPFWDYLLQEIVKIDYTTFSFSSYVSNRFNFAGVVPRDILARWCNTETRDYDRWLIKNYFFTSNIASNYPYFSLCLSEINNLKSINELPIKITERIFYFSEPYEQKKYAAERESLIKNSTIDKYVNETCQTHINEWLKEIANEDMNLAVLLCTGKFMLEKALLITWYADNVKKNLDVRKILEKYPELAMYLSDVTLSDKKEDNWHLQYFESYRQAKISDIYSEKIISFIKEKNHDKNSFYNWYHSFEESHECLVKHMSDKQLKLDKVYWIDALGAEFLPYILSCFNETNNFEIIYSAITHCTIPSATEQNKFEDVEKFGELDAIAHDVNRYKAYVTLAEELDVIKAIIQKIINSNSNDAHTFAIVSDHGLSCLSRKVDSKKYDTKVEHEGRYIKVTNEGTLYDDADYVVHKNERDDKLYKVALTHASLGSKPTHEVHGGCTPEEVLVPYIIVANKAKFTKYSYKLMTSEIEKSNPIVTVNIMPQPPMVKLIIDNKELQLERNGSKWSVSVDGLEEGEYNVKFEIPGGTSYSDTIKVNGIGIMKNDFLNF